MAPESGPAACAGAVFTVFGAGLLLWTWIRLRHRAPVVDGVNPLASATLAVLAAAGALTLGWWCFSRL